MQSAAFGTNRVSHAAVTQPAGFLIIHNNINPGPEVFWLRHSTDPPGTICFSGSPQLGQKEWRYVSQTYFAHLQFLHLGRGKRRRSCKTGKSSLA